MARGINKVILIGNLGRDPETRYTTGGDAVTNLNIATTETWQVTNKTKVTHIFHLHHTDWYLLARNGIVQAQNLDYTITGQQVTFPAPPGDSQPDDVMTAYAIWAV